MAATKNGSKKRPRNGRTVLVLPQKSSPKTPVILESSVDDDGRTISLSVDSRSLGASFSSSEFEETRQLMLPPGSFDSASLYPRFFQALEGINVSDERAHGQLNCLLVVHRVGLLSFLSRYEDRLSSLLNSRDPEVSNFNTLLAEARSNDPFLRVYHELDLTGLPAGEDEVGVTFLSHRWWFGAAGRRWGGWAVERKAALRRLRAALARLQATFLWIDHLCCLKDDVGTAMKTVWNTDAIIARCQVVYGVYSWQALEGLPRALSRAQSPGGNAEVAALVAGEVSAARRLWCFAEAALAGAKFHCRFADLLLEAAGASGPPSPGGAFGFQWAPRTARLPALRSPAGLAVAVGALGAGVGGAAALACARRADVRPLWRLLHRRGLVPFDHCPLLDAWAACDDDEGAPGEEGAAALLGPCLELDPAERACLGSRATRACMWPVRSTGPERLGGGGAAGGGDGGRAPASARARGSGAVEGPRFDLMNWAARRASHGWAPSAYAARGAGAAAAPWGEMLHGRPAAHAFRLEARGAALTWTFATALAGCRRRALREGGAAVGGAPSLLGHAGFALSRRRRQRRGAGAMDLSAPARLQGGAPGAAAAAGGQDWGPWGQEQTLVLELRTASRGGKAQAGGHGADEGGVGADLHCTPRPALALPAGLDPAALARALAGLGGAPLPLGGPRGTCCPRFDGVRRRERSEWGLRFEGAKALYRAGGYDAALAELEAVLAGEAAATSRQPEALRRRAACRHHVGLCRQGRFEAARRLHDDHRFPEAVAALRRVLAADAGAGAAAAPHLGEAERLLGACHEALFQGAKTTFRRGEYAAAVGMFREALALGPGERLAGLMGRYVERAELYLEEDAAQAGAKKSFWEPSTW